MQFSLELHRNIVERHSFVRLQILQLCKQFKTSSFGIRFSGLWSSDCLLLPWVIYGNFLFLTTFFFPHLENWEEAYCTGWAYYSSVWCQRPLSLVGVSSYFIVIFLYFSFVFFYWIWLVFVVSQIIYEKFRGVNESSLVEYCHARLNSIKNLKLKIRLELDRAQLFWTRLDSPENSKYSNSTRLDNTHNIN